MQANGNEKRLFISVRLALRSRWFSLFFAHVDLSPRKLIDYLIAAKKRHRITRSEIENGTAQFFLRGRRSLDVEPEANRSAKKRDPRKRDANTRYAHTI